MRNNLEGQRFWTGLPYGENPDDFEGDWQYEQPDHEKVCTQGRDYIVFAFDLSGGNLHAFEEHCAAATESFLRGVDWKEWMRVRALTREDALERYHDACDQYRFWSNYPKGIEPNERAVLDVVLSPPGDRPECPS